MSYKVVRNNGQVVAFGPNDNNYDPLLKTGDVLSIEQKEPALPNPIPESVPALDALLALDAAGLSADYEAWASDPARTFAERAFINKAQNWRRDDPTLKSAGTALGLTDEQIDHLFIDASKL